MAGIPNSELRRQLSWLTQAAPSRLVAAGGFCLFLLVTLIVLARRLAGAFSADISLAGYLGSLIAAGLICCLLKIMAESQHRLDRRATLIFGSLICWPLEVLALSLLPSEWSYTWVVLALAWSTCVAWFCLSMRSIDYLHYVAGEIVWPEIERFLNPPGEAARRASAELNRQVPLGKASIANPAGSSISTSHQAAYRNLDSRVPTELLACPESEGEGEIVSELQRRLTATGTDLLEGQLQAEFAAGSRQAVVHVPFIPPFSVAPRVECEIADGSDARVKVGAVFPYGARLELRRNTAELPEQQIALEIYAEVTSTTSVGAA